MTHETKTRVVAGLAAIVTGVMLIGTTGLTFVLGWGVWAVGLVVLLAAIPASGEKRPPRGKRMRVRVPARYSLVRSAASDR